MALQKSLPAGDAPSLNMGPSKFSNKVHEKAPYAEAETAACPPMEADVDIDLREVYFLIMHFLSAGPCHRTYGQFWNELLEHQLLPRRYHAWYSRSGVRSGDENDNGLSFPLSYNKLVERYPHIEKDHLVKLLKQLILNMAPPLHGMIGGNTPNAADVPTILGSGSFSLLESDRNKHKQINRMPSYLRWPHMQADQVRGLSLREIGGGFTKHHRAPSIRAACYAIAKPSTMVQKMQNIKKLRGHRDAVYCATLDCTGRYVITGSDDRLVKIWSMETAFCLASCRGHEGDITDLAVSSNNALVASSSNDFVIRVWRLPDGLPISVLRGHTGAVTTIAFSPRPSSVYQLLSSSDDGTCRIWDARNSNFSPRVYIPRPVDVTAGKSNGPSSSIGPQSHQILCCAFNANGTVFVTGSSDTLARVWNACKSNTEDSDQPNHEMDVLSGHENDVNYVQFSGCAVPSRYSTIDALKEDNVPKFKNSWFTHDNIVTCSRDGSAIIWIPRSRRSHGKVGRWTRAYHLKVPPPPMPPQPPRGGPRQRFLPTPRGVNMIVWSLDNRFVLAAIMDCRICVWNAADGSLVHSLTGHSESTYVLDVHPFNPRMAMSAGYDGKTILWDIWEGTPIRIYETGRFKLVDGKFSPDGTSIVLSDDVGQIYILNTGQGESQKDAKYDQFFLGDYRPLIQDTHGNVLDQETQLAPYRRNMQDLLCDSSMIPYPEPYQSMYQQRRLGAFGLEWRPPSVKYAVGANTSLGLQDYQMLPLPDLDRMIDPLPEFIDIMDWEPEIEVQSDDTDSEYNVTEEYSSEGEQGTAGTGSSSDPECSGEDSEVEHSHKDGLRRSKRKKHKEVEFMTSSGRRVKRRNLDERDGILSRTNRAKKSRSRRKASRMKSSTSKSSRPRRVAARNALNLFSRITGASTDGEDEVGSEGDSSDSELMNIRSYESDRSMHNGQEKHPREKESFLHATEDVFKPPEVPESVKNTGNRKRLVLKFSKKPLEGTRYGVENLVSLVGSSSRNPPEISKAYLGSKDPGSSSGHAIDTVLSQNCNGNKIRGRTLYERSEDHLDMPAGYKDNKIRWGEVKARTSKRLRLGMPTDACPGSIVSHDGHKELGNSVDELMKPENKKERASPCASEGLDGARSKELAPELVHESGLFKLSSPDELQQRRVASPVNCNGYVNRGTDDQSELLESRDYGDMVKDEKIESLCFTNHSEEAKENPPPSSTKFRIRTKWSSREPESPSKHNPVTTTEEWRSSACESMLRSPMPMEQNLILGVPGEDEGTSGHNQDHGDLNGLGKSEALIDKGFSSSALQDLKGLHSDSNNKICHVVYKRSKSYKARLDSEGDGGGTGESSSPTSNHNLDLRMDFPADAPDEPRRTRSMGMNATMQESNTLNRNFIVREGYGSAETSKSADKFTRNTPEQLLCEEWRSHSKMPVGLRSARNRRGNYYDGDMNLQDKRKSYHSVRKFSWLMLTEHEEGYRYIPQLGDEVIYLRQGHQEFMEMSQTVEAGPWKSIKGNVGATELCKVNELDYSTLAGSGESCCKITLEIIDSVSSVFGRTFKLTLPELNDFPDFIVEKTRYDAAIKRNWTHRDKCQVYWREENEEGGSWWEGRILAVKPKSSEFPDSPWERFVVSYKSDSTGQHLHCPWELHDPDIQWEHPHIDEQTREKLLTSFTKLEQSARRKEDYYGIQKLKQVGQKSDYLNRFPVPLSLKVVQQRLENNYYRSLEAVRHDVTVMLSNGQSYFAKNMELSTKMRRLSDWFSQKL
ncbi:PH-interacting protein-like isoform X2 [Telopea speciosissima]|uniref:PH-interacting protein-like isoform X2 n=2 Tax=Telopea speciosissima TaxID=54955 RepID=UPI001CC77FF5|nr:PH-interacting protein-like isoform X2 [Telopea speciosissima]